LDHQGVVSMDSLLHLLCESALSNIKIQKTGAMDAVSAEAAPRF